MAFLDSLREAEARNRGRYLAVQEAQAGARAQAQAEAAAQTREAQLRAQSRSDADSNRILEDPSSPPSQPIASVVPRQSFRSTSASKPNGGFSIAAREGETSTDTKTDGTGGDVSKSVGETADYINQGALARPVKTTASKNDLGNLPTSTAAAAGGALAGLGAGGPVGAVVGAGLGALGASAANFQEAYKAGGTNQTNREIKETFRPGSQAIENAASKAPILGNITDLVNRFDLAGKVVDSIIGSTKDDDQLYRDRIRDNFRESGFTDEKNGLELADGSTFDIGKDGGARLPNGNHYYDVDFEDPLAEKAVGLTSPLAYLLTGGDKKLSSDFAGYFTNAALSNAGGDAAIAKKNIEGFYKKLGATKADLIATFEALRDKGEIDKNRLEAYVNSINELDIPEGEKGGGEPIDLSKIELPSTTVNVTTTTTKSAPSLPSAPADVASRSSLRNYVSQNPYAGVGDSFRNALGMIGG